MAEETMKDFEKEIAESFKSKKQLEDADAGKWEKFAQMMADGEKVTIKVAEAVKGGVVAFVDDVRGFIPASHLSTQHVENLEDFVNKELEVVFVTVDDAKKRLVMSHRALEKDARKAGKAAKLAAIHAGDVIKGKVESLKDYGAFVDLGDGVSGLLHVSQLAWKRVKSPADMLKEGQEVEVKVLGVENGKVSLSIKALTEAPEGFEEKAPREPRERKNDETDGFKYEEKGQAVTSLGDLLKGIKL